MNILIKKKMEHSRIVFFETETLFSFSTYILFGLHLKIIYQFYLINFLLSHETVYKAGR